MKAKFLTFFSLISLAGVLSIATSWIIQGQLHGGIDFSRAIFQLGLLALVLYLVWGRSTPSYILATFYVIANAALYSYELVQFFVLGNAQAQLPMAATITSILLILSGVGALVLFALDYFDYLRRRIPIDY